MKAIERDILSILIEENRFISLNELSFKLKRHNVTPRSIQREMKNLEDSNRIDISGSASTTQYCIEDIQRTYPSGEFLYVYKNNVIVGQLFKLKDRYRFYYDSEYLSKYTEQIPSLELSLESSDFANIPPVFEENIPEGINRDILEATHKTVDEFEILNIMDDNIGDLCFSKTKEKCYISEEMATGYLNNLDEILGSNSKINVLEGFKLDMGDAEIFPEAYDLSKLQIVQSHGISGFQYKRLVNIDFDNKVISVNDRSHEYIFKPFSKLKSNKDSEHYFPHISFNEHLHISFAKNELGLKAPYSAIVKRDEDEEYHYVVKRFDRLGVNRFAKSCFAVFLGLRSESKYDTTSEKMFKRMAKELISPAERMALLSHYLYSIIIVHEDLHTKNLSLIYDKSKVLFSPLYDVACTGCYDSTKGYESRLTINGKQEKIRPNDFKPLCTLLGIDFKEFKAVAKEMVGKYVVNMPSYFDEAQKLGSIPFYRKKLVKKRGNSEVVWKVTDKPIEFVDVLREHHILRCKSLEELGWFF